MKKIVWFITEMAVSVILMATGIVLMLKGQIDEAIYVTLLAAIGLIMAKRIDP